MAGSWVSVRGPDGAPSISDAPSEVQSVDPRSPSVQLQQMPAGHDANFVERLCNRPLLQDDLDLQNVVLKTMESLNVSMKDHIPALLNRYSRQINQVQDTLGGHLQEILVDGQIDVEKAYRLIDLVVKQLGESRIVQQIRQELQELEHSFDAETRGPKGLLSALKQKRDSIKYELYLRSCFAPQQKVAITACGLVRDLYVKHVRPYFEGIFMEHFVDRAAAGSAGGTMCCALSCGKPLACLVGLAVGTGLQSLVGMFHSCRTTETGESAAQTDHLNAKLKDVDHFLRVCSKVERILQDSKKHVEEFEFHLDDFKNQKEQIEFLLENRIDATRWSCARLCDFLRCSDLGHCAEPFETYHVGGKAFLDNVSETVLKDKFKITDELVLRRLLALQQELASRKLVGPSPKITDLADSLTRVFEGMKCQVDKMKTYLGQF